jgi:ABC-type dipeptide/oligopeptide/nickel transport systems, permease components
VRRLGMFFLTVWLGTTLIFAIPRLAPGDPVAAMVNRMTAQSGAVVNSAEIIKAWRVRFGLDQPILVQYVRYLYTVSTFQLGPSLAHFPTNVQDLVIRAFPWTLGLLSLATIISFIAGNAVGALLAWRRTPNLARALLPITLTFTSIPPFMLGILLIYLFAFGLKWFPFSGAYDLQTTVGLNWKFIVEVVRHGTLPALSIVVTTMGFWALGMRGMMVTTDGEDYMILAQAKGLRSGRIFMLYGVRNAILPQVTALALSLGALAGGSVIVEYIFTYPGMGYLLYDGIVNSDYTLIQGVVFFLIVGVALAVLIIDLLYPLIDPRISYQKK